MGDLFWNKVFGALLATALSIFGIKELGHALIESHEPAEPGYKIAVASEGEGEEKAAEVVEVISLAQMLSTASASAGERVVKKCAACHSFDQGGANKTGPNLWNIIGRTAASHEGFGYSDAMKAFGGTWDYENLNAFLSSPKTKVPGTAMSFAGLKKPKDAANVLAYLRTLSDAPVALPALSASVTDAADDAQGAVDMAEGGAEEAGNSLIEKIVDAAQDGADAVADMAKDGADAAAGVMSAAEMGADEATGPAEAVSEAVKDVPHNEGGDD